MIRIYLFCFAMLVATGALAQPVRVASINLCADQLVMLLADPGQILTVTNLSHQQAGSYYYREARGYPANKGHSEEILRLAPDVVIAGQYTSVYSVKLLREVGLNVQILPIANDLDTLFTNIANVALWVGQSQRGDDIINGLKQRLANLQPHSLPRPLAAVFDPNGYTSGTNTLRGQLMQLSGWENAASVAGINSYGQLTLEQIIKLSPDALIDSPYSPGTYSRAQVTSRHPALLKAGVNPQIISIPSRKMVCAGPWTIDVLELLQSERIRISG